MEGDLEKGSVFGIQFGTSLQQLFGIVGLVIRSFKHGPGKVDIP